MTNELPPDDAPPALLLSTALSKADAVALSEYVSKLIAWAAARERKARIDTSVAAPAAPDVWGLHGRPGQHWDGPNNVVIGAPAEPPTYPSFHLTNDNAMYVADSRKGVIKKWDMNTGEYLGEVGAVPAPVPPAADIAERRIAATHLEDAERIAAYSRQAGPAPKKPCGSPLAAGQWWTFCGETDMGQTAPVLCNVCQPKYGCLRQGATAEEVAALKKRFAAALERYKAAGFVGSVEDY